MKATLGLSFLRAATGGLNLTEFIHLGELEYLFTANELPAYEFVREHTAKHGTLPQVETIELHSGVTLPAVKEPASYYLEHMRQRYVDRGLREAIEGANEYLKPGKDKDPQGALAALIASMYELEKHELGAQLHDFRDALTPVMASHAQTYSGEGGGIEMGWPTLDTMMGGAQPGDLISFVGRPSKGKTWKLLYSAHHAWKKQHKTVLFVTLEMKALLIEKRLAALHTHVPGMLLKLGQLSPKYLAKLKGGLEEAHEEPAPFYILDGGFGLTVDRLRMVVSHLKPDVVFVDGAYMLDHADARLSFFQRITESCKQLKALAMEGAIPVFATWQFRRDNTKKKDGSVIEVKSLDDVYGSDAIAQYSSLVVGLFQPQTVETILQKTLTILKGREGESGEFQVNWDFAQMDFSEYVPKTKEEGQELHYV